VTGERVFGEDVAECVRAVMLTCGMYDTAGRFAFEVGLPAKSGVGGGLLAVAPGRLGIGLFSPRLDDPVRALLAARDLSRALGLHVFGPSGPAPSSTLPSTEAVEAACSAALAVRGGEVATYIPELARADPGWLGLAVCGTSGDERTAGDADRVFTLQSTAHPFAYGLALEARGADAVHRLVGVEPSGNPYHAMFDPATRRPFNPLVNAGAMAVASVQPGGDGAERLAGLLSGLAAFAGEDALHLDDGVLRSERAAAHRNRAIAHLLRHFGVVEDEEAALELYLAQCSVSLACRQLARMAATLAAGGVSPRTGRRVLSARHVEHVLAVMATCGMNEGSGQFAFEVGLPAKSGISGVIVAVLPGRWGAAAFSPPVDPRGNSVPAMAALRALARG
jgi:glutaminase